MEHRGIRYAVRIGIAREEWRVVIHIPDKRLPVERAVFGTRADAKTEARSMINAWLKKQSAAARFPGLTTPADDPPEAPRIAANVAKLRERMSIAFLYSPSTRRRCSSRISSATLVRDRRTSSANGAFGRHDRHDSAGMRLVTAASW